MTKETKQKLTTVLAVTAVLIAITALIFWGLRNIDKSASSDSKSLLSSNTETNKPAPIKLDLPASVKQNQSAQTYTATQNPDQSTDITLASQDFFKLNLPQNLNQPVSVLLSNSRTIALSQQGENNLQAIEKTQIKTTPENEKLLAIIQKDPSLKIYQNENQTTFYTAQESKNENQQWLLKNWTLYSAPASQEAQPPLGGLASSGESASITQAFKIQNATVNLDSSGNANVFFGTAQAKNQNPDFVIPRPYLLDKNAVRKDLDWKFEKTTNLLSVTFTMPKESFPIALDPSILKTNKVVATFSGRQISMHAPPACNAIIPGQTCTFGGITYSVVNGPDGKVWMDRNLGATAVATAFNTQAAYGWLYQWGRLSDGHQYTAWGGQPAPALSTAIPNTTSGLAFTGDANPVTTPVSVNSPNTAYFITNTNGANDFDWLSTPITGDPTNLWDGTRQNNPCPTGFRLPTGGTYTGVPDGNGVIRGEWEHLVSLAGITNYTTAASSVLHLPAAGNRRIDGTLANQGSYGRYWSSSPNSAYAYNLYFNSGSVYPTNYDYRAYGFSVRCLKN